MCLFPAFYLLDGGERRGVSPTCANKHVRGTPRRSPLLCRFLLFSLEDAEADVLQRRGCVAAFVVRGTRGTTAHRLALVLFQRHPLRRVAAQVEDGIILARRLEPSDLAQQRRRS